eukprot:COSAG01_NODE_1806_length_9192_cov_11.433410_2_plen_117_part_00
MLGAVAAAPPPAVYHLCQPEDWDDWYGLVCGLVDAPPGMQLLETVARELRDEGVPFAEKWGDSLTDLQLGRLRMSSQRTMRCAGSRSMQQTTDYRVIHLSTRSSRTRHVSCRRCNI